MGGARQLIRDEPGNAQVSCPVCAAPSREAAFRATIRGKYDVQYWYCADCGTLQTEHPYWLPETYGTDCGDFDTDQAARNLHCARRVAGLLYFMFNACGTQLDYAGGYGLFTRLMRDIGFDCRWWDPYTPNLFAKGFEAEPGQRFDVVTAFEVLEHTVDPVSFIADLRSRYACRALVFSTQIFRGAPPSPHKWSYYGLAGGQHVSFYQARSLDRIAQRVGARFVTNGRIHMFAWPPINYRLFHFLTSQASWFIELYVRSRMQSRTMSDQALLARQSMAGPS
jgi:hypothetical protein